MRALSRINPFAFETLYGKLAAIFAVLLFVMGGIQLYLSARGWIGFVQEAEQRLHWGTADKLRTKIERYVRVEPQLQAIEDALSELLLPPAQYDLYLLKRDGTIIFHQAPPGRILLPKVSTKPIDEFLRRDRIAAGAILGDDPKMPSEKTVFSVAPIKLLDQEGFVYVVLGANQYRNILDVLGKSYFLDVTLLGLSVSVLAVASVGLVAFFLLTKPLSSIVSTVERFKSGDLSARAAVRSNDELDILATTFNSMASTIESTIQELEQQNTLRRELVANISHDLRGPLTAMRSCLDTAILQFDTLPKDEVRDRILSSQASIEFLQGLIGELFELSKLEARAVAPNLQAFSIEELCDDIVMLLRSRAEESGLSLHFEYDEGSRPVSADIAMLGKVIANLIENAIRYTDPPGTISVKTTQTPSGVQVQVADTGIGIPADELPKIFSRFYRVSQGESERAGSTGLGLAIVKEILVLHRIEIEVESRVGRGSTFSFMVPYAAAKAAEESAAH